MPSFEVDGFTFSLSETQNRITVFKDNALADYYNYSTRAEAEADFEKIKKCTKVTFASNDNNNIKGKE